MNGVFSEEGLLFFNTKLSSEAKNGIIEEAIDIHCDSLMIPEKIIRDHYFDFWANWKPGNTTDLYVYCNEELNRYCRHTKTGEIYKGKGLFLYIAAKYNFRCCYTKVPLLPIKPGNLGNEVSVDEFVAQMYAWYPSIDHNDSTVQEERIRHSIDNICLAGHEVNRLFGKLNKNSGKELMRHISGDIPLNINTAKNIAIESLKKSSRKKRNG